MTADVADAAQFVGASHRRQHLLFQDVEFPVKTLPLTLPVREGGVLRDGMVCPNEGTLTDGRRLGVNLFHDLPENPRPAERCSAHHDSVHAIAFEGLYGALCRGDVSIANDGNIHAWIALHLADERPVGLVGVELRARAAMNRQCRDTAILQLLCQLRDNQVLLVPAQPRLHGHRHLTAHRIHHGACDFQQFRYIAQHAGTSSLGGNLLYGAAEVQVQHIRVRLFDHDACGLRHGFRLLAVNLYGHRAFFIAHLQLLQALVDHSHEGIGCHKF